MQILVDADACPVVGIVEKIAKQNNVPCTLLCDTNHVLDSNYSQVKVIGAGADAVDYALIKICQRGDIVVSQDYGVAAMALGKGAYAIHQSGKWYSNDNIDQMLMERHVARKARMGKNKKHLKGPSKRTDEDDKRFEESFFKLLKIAKEVNLDAIKGSLFGGAVGDALGYAVEFKSWNEIQREFGQNGITEYALDEETQKALISDDTQMTLFTAMGILVGETRGALRGMAVNSSCYIGYCYKDWLKTQKFNAPPKKEERRDSWLAGVPELYSRRAPGNTCLKAVSIDKYGSIEEHLNDSKGCGGIMRVAPLGIHYDHIEDVILAKEGAEIAALTHGHSLGYMPAATLTIILNRAVFHKNKHQSLKEIILEAKRITDEVFAGDIHLKELDAIIDKALELAENQESDEVNIKKIGEGWVAEETLAIAIYCSLKYQDCFSKAIIASVNHDGDSDSTGAVTGNIMGAWLGYDEIEEKWKHNLELSDIILEIADDLCHGCVMSQYGDYKDEAWIAKYVNMESYRR